MSGPELPDVSAIRARTVEKLGRRPCLWQCDVARALLERKKDVVCISGTGSGKTLTFWMPLLFRPHGVQVIITPLNLLGSQNKAELGRWKIGAIALSGETATLENFKAAGSLRHGVVVLNPEIAFRHKACQDWLWKNSAFTSRIISVVWDEAHCIKAWGKFRPDLAAAGRLRNMLPPGTPYLIPSATLPSRDRADVLETLQVRPDNILLMRRSNDRPNVYLTVQRFRYPMSSFQDLDFLIPKDWAPDQPDVRIPPFLVFFDSIDDSIKAAERLRKLLTKAHCDRVVWFNSDNTPEFREDVTSEFRAHKICGLYCTDSFGMGVDISDIEVIVQWRVMCSMNAMWQRFGRAARGSGREAIAILLAEPKYFDDAKAEAAAREEKKQAAAARRAAKEEAGKRKRSESSAASTSKPPAKRGKKVAHLREIAAEGDQERTDRMEVTLPESDAADSGATRTRASGGGGVDCAGGAGAGPNGGQPMDTDARTGTKTVSLTVFEQLRVEYVQSHRALEKKARRGKVAQGTGTSASDEDATLAPELDNFVNAAFRTSIQCYRKPITAFYENDRIQLDPRGCAPGLEDPCPRCVPMPSPVCCSLCTPSHPLFLILPPLEMDDTPPPKTTSSRASRITSAPMTDADSRLKAALHAFRREQTIKAFGRRHLNSNGPGAVMGDDILDRIVECARVHKLADVEGLYRETKWNRALELGTAVLSIVHEFHPMPTPLVPVPEQQQAQHAEGNPTAVLDGASTSKGASGPRRCGVCRGFGHRRNNPICPKFQATVSAADGEDKENREATLHAAHPETVPSTPAKGFATSTGNLVGMYVIIY